MKIKSIPQQISIVDVIGQRMWVEWQRMGETDTQSICRILMGAFPGDPDVDFILNDSDRIGKIYRRGKCDARGNRISEDSPLYFLTFRRGV